MNFKKLLTATALVGSMAVAGLANAAGSVTLNPSANNGGTGVIDAGTGSFQTVGASANLLSTLVISTNTGISTFSETGTVFITSFQNSAQQTITGANVNKATGGTYDIYATFALSGIGQWGGNVFTAAPGALSFSIDLFATSATNQTIALGTASLLTAPTNFAFAILGGSTAAGSSGTATTSLGALLDFVPAPGTEGVNGFFQAPTPFSIDIGVGNAGGNPANTTYSVDNNGVVTVVTGTPGANTGTANLTFIVPEPGALSLVGFALLGLGVASRRRKVVQA